MKSLFYVLAVVLGSVSVANACDTSCKKACDPCSVATCCRPTLCERVAERRAERAEARACRAEARAERVAARACCKKTCCETVACCDPCCK
jgi:hypothetical protein